MGRILIFNGVHTGLSSLFEAALQLPIPREMGPFSIENYSHGLSNVDSIHWIFQIYVTYRYQVV